MTCSVSYLWHYPPFLCSGTIVFERIFRLRMIRYIYAISITPIKIVLLLSFRQQLIVPTYDFTVFEEVSKR